MVEHNHKNPESVRLHLHLFRRLRNVLTSAINVTEEEKDGVREVVIYRDTQLKIKLPTTIISTTSLSINSIFDSGRYSVACL